MADEYLASSISAVERESSTKPCGGIDVTGSVGSQGAPTETSTAEEDARLSQLGYKAELSRSLRLSDVVIHGLIYMVPIAPISVFGVVYSLSGGTIGAVYVITAIVMALSALSYREMALQFAVASSASSTSDPARVPRYGPSARAWYA